MNVLQLCTKVPIPAKDGGALAVMSFARLLKLKEHSVTILAANTIKHFQPEVLNEADGISLKAVNVPAGISFPGLIGNLFFSITPYNISRFWNEAFAQELIRLISGNKFDIIQLEGPHMGIYLPEIRKYSNAKVILRAHNIEHLLWQDIRNETSSLLKKGYLSMMANRLMTFEKKLIEDVDAVIAISENDLQNMLKSFKPKQYCTIPFGIDMAQYSLPAEGEDNTMFFLGALDWIPNQKGLLWFLENVWPVLIKKFPAISLHVAGRNAPEWLVERLHGFKIKFYGEIPDSKEFMRKFQIQIVPLFSGSGLRIKILEGMAMEKVIVTTPKGMEGIGITPGKELVIADDAESFIRGIQDLLSDKNKRNSIGTDARAFISKEFDNLALANKVDRFYRKLISV